MRDCYNNVPYYFIKNLQGDVIAIANARGEVVARYSYDAWGVCTVVSDTADGIANINPYRYRCYYYDAEIAKYYLQSRYYDAETGRFVNGDEVEIALLGVDFSIEQNYFVYCQKNPTNDLDLSGFVSLNKIFSKIKDFLNKTINKIKSFISNNIYTYEKNRDYFR